MSKSSKNAKLIKNENMRKFLFCLVFAILLSNTGKAYADQRVVTSYIISDVWYENIFTFLHSDLV